MLRSPIVALSIPALLLACVERREPPGVQAKAPEAVEVHVGQPADAGVSERRRGKVSRGSIEDDLPFEPTGEQLASIAWRTWVYTDTGPKRTRYGYLRAGAVVDARGPAIVNDGCAGGWYRINPRGFVCLGKGATLDLNHPVVQQASVRPVRGQGLPYLYALSSDSPPMLYFKLPTRSEMQTVEGEQVLGRAARYRERVTTQGLAELLGEPGAPPAAIVGQSPLAKPYGVEQRLHYSVHAGRASADSGFAIGQAFIWETRWFGLTTELDLIALDRTNVVKPSDFHGVELGQDEGLPVAFVDRHYAQKYAEHDGGSIQPDGAFRYRQGLKLTGRKRGRGLAALWETRDGAWVVGEVTRRLEPRESFPSFATGNRKWIDISINQQSLVAYVGRRPVYATLVSTGRGGLGDPETEHATVRGTFMIHAKHVTSTMDGDDDRSDSFNLRDVPFVQYFHKGFALHGTYWHDDFGKIRSHGCVNLSPIDSAWLFEWTDPAVPPDWHGYLNKDRGTVVFIHP